MKSTREIRDEAKQLKVFRKSENMSQDEFGAKTGVDGTTVSKYENGRLIIPIDYVRTLHEKLNMSFQWFFTGKGSKKHTADKANLVTDMKTLMTNQELLYNQVESLKADLVKLHRDFHDLKNQPK